MPPKFHRCLQVLAGLTFLFCGLGIISTIVSLKYETEANKCISTVDGRDLCQALHYNWILLGGAFAFIVALSLLEIKIAKPKH
ncbi:hypothetical protein [Hymenobacter sp. PAMC 26628]|uniref:hypothetical protein n=1 Tax=Hymenobacter sp. PAMC 26628 TaxID=1484118 RepID=UPI000B2AA87A|nr:hypothetical protein [Hymenobacter sp. PAMC 26628]